MHTVTIHASDVQPEQLSGIMSDYLALERARIFRRLLVTRFSVLAVIFGAVSFLWVSAFASWFCAGLCVAVPIWAWIVELGCERRLARRLAKMPAQTVQVVKSGIPNDITRKNHNGVA